jgi:ribosomal protein L37AE/L43A
MENPIRRQYRKYTNAEERRKGLLEAFLRYATKPWRCDICGKTILKGNKSNHLKSKKHNQKMSLNN